MPELLGPGIVKFPFSKKIALSVLDECKKLSEDSWINSEVYEDGKGHVNKSQRNNKSLPLQQINDSLNKEVLKAVDMNSNLYKGMYSINFENNEGIDVLKYNPGEYFLKHYDGSINRYRTVSLLVYLNPGEYSGGETKFYNFNLSVNPTEPCMIFFPSNYPYAHSSNEIISGTKYILVSWFNDLPKNKRISLV